MDHHHWVIDSCSVNEPGNREVVASQVQGIPDIQGIAQTTAQEAITERDLAKTNRINNKYPLQLIQYGNRGH